MDLNVIKTSKNSTFSCISLPIGSWKCSNSEVGYIYRKVFRTLPFLNFDELHILQGLEGLSGEGLQTRVDDFFSQGENKLISPPS